MSTNDITNKKLSNKQPETDIFIHSFTPMLDTLHQNLNIDNSNDSLCTRFIRKKFFCIMCFFMVIIICMHFFNTVTEKLSQNDVQQIYRGMAQVIKKISKLNNTITPDTMEPPTLD
jgi:hypothetical protein